MANSAFTHDPQITVPGSSTDNAVVIFDGTAGTGFGNSTILVDSGGNGRIGIAADVDLLALASGALTVNGTIGSGAITSTGVVTATGFTIGSAAITEAELEILDGATVTTTELNLLDALDRGSILYGNASGVTTVLGQGTTDQVLTSDGTDISWEDAAAGGASLSGSTNNTVTTVTGSNAIQGEAGLTYDGTSLVVQKSGAAATYIDSYSLSGAAPGNLQLRHSNHGTLGTQAAMDSGDELGRIDFGGSNGSAFAKSLSMLALTTQAWTACNNGAKLIFYTTADGANSQSTALVINEKRQTLHSNGTAAAPSVSFNDNQNMGFFRASGSVIGVASCGNEYFRIGCGGRFFVKDDNNAKMSYGITINQVGTDNEILAFKSSDIAHGVTTLAETDTYFAIQKSSGANGGSQFSSFSCANDVEYHIAVSSTDCQTKGTNARAAFSFDFRKASGTGTTSGTSDTNILKISHEDTARFFFDTEGSGHADVEWTTYSDDRLKFNQQVIPYGLDTLMQLQPKIYCKDSGYLSCGVPVLEGHRRRQIGFVAQEVMALMPEAVKDICSSTSWYSLEDGKLTAVVVKAIQELNDRVVALEG